MDGYGYGAAGWTLPPKLTDWKESVRAATLAALPAYTANSSTQLTANANGAFAAVDGITLAQGERVLVKNEAGAARANHGIWRLTQVGDAGTPWILNRPDDANTSGTTGNVGCQLVVRVEEGTQASSEWALTTLNPIVLGTTVLTFTQVIPASGAAPADAAYLVVSLDATLTNERVLTAPPAGLTLVDAGPGTTLTLTLADDLAAVEGLGTTGLAVRSALNTWVTRALTAPAAGLTIANADGVGGSPTFALANDLAALEALAGTGYAQRTGVDTWTLITDVLRGALGATDNAILRADGVGGGTGQGSSVTLDDNGVATFPGTGGPKLTAAGAYSSSSGLLTFVSLATEALLAIGDGSSTLRFLGFRFTSWVAILAAGTGTLASITPTGSRLIYVFALMFFKQDGSTNMTIEGRFVTFDTSGALTRTANGNFSPAGFAGPTFAVNASAGNVVLSATAGASNGKGMAIYWYYETAIP